MIPLRHEQASVVMKAPPGNPEVRDLHVAIINGCSVSRWEPTPAELTMLNEGGSVELWVMGKQPPVALQAAPHADAATRPAGDGDAR